MSITAENRRQSGSPTSPFEAFSGLASENAFRAALLRVSGYLDEGLITTFSLHSPHVRFTRV